MPPALSLSCLIPMLILLLLLLLLLLLDSLRPDLLVLLLLILLLPPLPYVSNAIYRVIRVIGVPIIWVECVLE
jgi:hypothetical protein